MSDPFAGLTADAMARPPSKPAPRPIPKPVSSSVPKVDEDLDSERLKTEVLEQEQAVASQLNERFRNMQEEQRKLAHAKKELESMDFDHRRDIDVLRAKIETNSRELSYANQTLREKIEEHRVAGLEVERLTKNKQMLTEHLRVIIYDNETKKKKKLAELMNKLNMTNTTGGKRTFTSAASSTTTTTTTRNSPKEATTATRASSWSGF
jgi:hypothetical protein